MPQCVTDLGNGYYLDSAPVDSDNPNPQCDFYIVVPSDYNSSVANVPESHLTYVEVSLIFTAAAFLYSLVFVYKLALKQLGF
jgi:hypothetical protein